MRKHTRSWAAEFVRGHLRGITHVSIARREQHAVVGRASDDRLLVDAQLIEQEVQSA